MATLTDTALGTDDASGTTLSTSDTVTYSAGDLLIGGIKWEGASTTVQMDTGASTPVWTEANAVLSSTSGPSSGDLNGAVCYWVATSGGTLSPRCVLGAARAFRRFKVYVFRPASGYTLRLGNVNAAYQTATTTPSAGAANAVAAGAATTYFHAYGTEALTPGAGWSEAAEFNISDSQITQYQLQSGSGSLTGTGDYGGGVEDTISQIAIFDETGTNPIIVDEPTDLAAVFGSAATFTVNASSATGTTLSYQWTENGANVGTNASSYTTSQTFAADQNARFAVSVWDVNGTTDSRTAYLRLTFSSGAYAQEIADRYLMEDGGGVYLIEPWGGGAPAVTYGPFFLGPLNGLGSGGRTQKNRLH